MLNAISIQIPLGVHFNLYLHDYPNTSDEIEYMFRVLYFSVIGSVMFIMVCTRPNLTYIVSVLISRYIFNPNL